jgi:hypothetical protein
MDIIINTATPYLILFVLALWLLTKNQLPPL